MRRHLIENVFARSERADLKRYVIGDDNDVAAARKLRRLQSHLPRHHADLSHNQALSLSHSTTFHNFGISAHHRRIRLLSTIMTGDFQRNFGQYVFNSPIKKNLQGSPIWPRLLYCYPLHCEWTYCPTYTASNTHFLGPSWVSTPNGISTGSAVIAYTAAKSHNAFQWGGQPQKLSLGDWTPI